MRGKFPNLNCGNGCSASYTSSVGCADTFSSRRRLFRRCKSLPYGCGVAPSQSAALTGLLSRGAKFFSPSVFATLRQLPHQREPRGRSGLGSQQSTLASPAGRGAHGVGGEGRAVGWMRMRADLQPDRPLSRLRWHRNRRAKGAYCCAMRWHLLLRGSRVAIAKPGRLC